MELKIILLKKEDEMHLSGKNFEKLNARNKTDMRKGFAAQFLQCDSRVLLSGTFYLGWFWERNIDAKYFSVNDSSGLKKN